MADVVQVRRAHPFETVVASLGLLLMVAQLPFYVAAGVVAPTWGALVLSVAWVTLFTLGLRWYRDHPSWVLLVPVLAAAVWITSVTVVEPYLGWGP
ncbi:hypothetical protein [Occultella gossypii]|uniref:Sensor histidine kinase n=1 Tax=Occultella gossypii TaxID=2800820 RepID=A0ABS7SB22_9MICO|nr:hypothetical protein [Occultella gossypii]MBZ2197554.1 hypothetical protein [Occultella gossypii]